jgi:COP9 signalosome complex subunit 2
MSDEDDYGFEYSDEEDVDEDAIDIENEYYNAKGTRVDTPAAAAIPITTGVGGYNETD